MSTNDRRTEFLARSIVNRLEDRGVVEFGDAEAGILVVTRTLAENLNTAEAIEQEARQKFAGRRREPSAEEIENEMKRIAAERGFIL